MAQSTHQHSIEHRSSEHRSSEHRSTEGDTRRHVMETLLTDGPLTAADLGDQLGISAAGVRRHLDILVGEGVAETITRPGTAPRKPGAAKSKGRGRPAKYYRLTDAGRNSFGHAYDSLATEALDALRAAGGPDAVKAFAKARMERIVGDVEPAASDASDAEVEQKVKELAEKMAQAGYAATTTSAGSGVQLCQHHCPVSSVAAAHPELCEAEREAFSAVIGQHIQPLATISNGHGICTTNIPLHSIDEIPNERSDS